MATGEHPFQLRRRYSRSTGRPGHVMTDATTPPRQGGATEIVDDDIADEFATNGTARRRRFGRRSRNIVLTVHIVVSVGLLGDSAGFLAVAIRRSTSDDPAFVESAHELLGMFVLLFGIPLSFLTLLTGIALGLGTPWGCSAIRGSSSSSF